MSESIKLWAKYNLATDEKVNVLLAGLAPDAYTRERNTFFKSLAALHLHYVQTYKFYQNLIRKYSNEKYFASPLTDESFEVKSTTLEETAKLAIEYDKLFLAFADIVDDDDLDSPKSKRTMRNGKTYLLSISDIVTQYQNHTAHHRGQLSQLLDELGVEHDIGGLLVFAEESVG
jgi:uncharacterized damage-inducible protein DinB